VLNWFNNMATRHSASSSAATAAKIDPRKLRSERPVSLRDVANRAKVSVATVSMVLNDNPRISRATQMRVQRMIQQLGYRPNRLAQSLSSRYTQVLAILLPALRHGFSDAYFGELISGICDRAGKMGYKVMLEQAKPDFVKQREHIELYERRFIDGLLCLGCNDRHHFLKEFSDRRYPLVVVDNCFSQWGLDYVMCDYSAGAEQMMNYLLQLGHRRIALITAAPEVRTARDVADVYRQKLKEARCPVPATQIADGKFTEEGGAEAAGKLIERHPNLTAIFAGNDKMAIGAMHALHRRGVKVPEDVSVVGFDDLQQSAFVNPSLTTIHLPLYQVGVLATEKLIERIHATSERVEQTLSTHLVVRDSTAIARNIA
jgi:LacI family transcriptional regulator